MSEFLKLLTQNDPMVEAVHKQSEISDLLWKKLEPHLPGRKGTWGGVAEDNRRFIEAVFWVIRNGVAWRDLPEALGSWGNTHRRFIRWRDRGIWEKLLEILIDEPGFEWLMMDTRQELPSRIASADLSSQNCICPWVRMVCRSGLLLQKVQQQIILRHSPDSSV